MGKTCKYTELQAKPIPSKVRTFIKIQRNENINFST